MAYTSKKNGPERHDLVICAMHQQHRHRCLLDGLHPTRNPTAPPEESPPNLSAQANKESKSCHTKDAMHALWGETIGAAKGSGQSRVEAVQHLDDRQCLDHQQDGIDMA
jgi:hypothetical protein